MPAGACASCSARIPAGSRFCPACGAAVEDLTSAPTQMAPPPEPRSASSASAPSSDGGRFVPGQVLSDRYRVIGLLGQGGMGEVYRADDLKLGQTVALKFLPQAFADDPERLERFFNEVRTARQVTHANVCRVHDLGEIEGQYFLSMEYVDGEDLATLLRRIGRVPKDKALEIARQLCAGLAAAHEQGILHRDLKPANIMLDGRGRVRITDFGLAGLAESIGGQEVLAGTPAYQAPEQLEGREVSRASDIYALGLLLYEIFTGRRPFEARSREELLGLQQSTTPASLASHVEGLDESIERVILRCLEPDPGRRPASALAVSAALPGGDPLAAALAAGETPSPEMVADAGETGTLRPAVALGLLAVILTGLGIHFAVHTRRSALARVGLPKPPAELRVLARQVLEQIGHEAPAGDTAWGLADSSYFDWVERTDSSPDRWDDLGSVRPHPITYWYRQSPEWMKVRGADVRVSEGSPPLDEPGMASVRLDAAGRLLRLRIVPPAVRPPAPASEGGDAVAWRPALERAGLDPAALTPVTPRANPPVACDSRAAWEGADAGGGETPLRVEACGSAGALLYFEVFAPWSSGYDELRQAEISPAAAGESPADGPPVIFEVAIQLIYVVLILGTALLARRNLRLGRADQRGAFRIALFVLLVRLVSQLLSANHPGPGFEEIAVLGEVIAHALTRAIFAWGFYLAAEPLVRRIWPDSIIGWRRLLEGRLRDPLVGRDVLIGGAFVQVTLVARLLVPLVSQPPQLLDAGSLGSISGTAQWASRLLALPTNALVFSLGVMVAVVLGRLALRRSWLTWLVLTALITTLPILAAAGQWGSPLRVLVAFLLVAAIWGSVFLVTIRFGLLALTITALYSGSGDMVSVLDPGSWFFGHVLAFALIVLVAPALWAFWTSLGGRRVLRAELLDG